MVFSLIFLTISSFIFPQISLSIPSKIRTHHSLCLSNLPRVLEETGFLSHSILRVNLFLMNSTLTLFPLDCTVVEKSNFVVVRKLNSFLIGLRKIEVGSVILVAHLLSPSRLLSVACLY